MIIYTKGNLLEANNVDALINAVNTVGVMGKGIAFMFKKQYPENFEAYKKACKNGKVKTGKMFVTKIDSFVRPKFIINFPTKQDWRNDTKIEWVEEGLKDLTRVLKEKNINSVAIPPLGCGNGGLNWSDVQPLIESAFKNIESVKAIVYEPI